MLTDKFLLLSSSFATTYLSHVESFTSPANAGRIDDFLKEHFESKIAAAKDIYQFDGVNGHIRINGPMSPEGPDLYDLFYGFGGVAYADILDSIAQAKQDIDPQNGQLYLHTNTPGGTVSMVDDVYQALKSCTFKTVMINKGMVASGGMWIGAACDRIVASTPVAFTGSIGVVISCYDVTGMLEKLGVKRVVITNHEASNKVPDISTDEGQKVIQEELNAIYSVFKDRVVKGRSGKISAETIDGLKGGVRVAADALAVGLIDAITETVGKIAAPAKYQTKAPAGVARVANQKGQKIMTLDQLRAEHPDLVAAIAAEATEGMITATDLQTQLATVKAEGAAAERARIQAVEDQLIPGHEVLIAGLKFDGKTSGPEAAAQVLAAEKGARAKALADLSGEGNLVVPAAALGDGAQTMKRSEFNALDQPGRRTAIAAGVKIVD
ncbi:S49 family peptidase [Syntrophotalea acetylenica]|uniref:Peptidase S49 domain-containing protein n=1 Tax=Syntrophotalea acetylenica TaxID=29542 RepID=A0A1L3GDW3_SYNAC|nr:S49 family peptidase [Syntrophotalea acetylenica]APG24097.1 hypothetical protein A7E75_02915 [Syntrophotalea acetylenica]APG44679.1 hypothetical protein A6070_11540 [Syntrophotalea acetylenica]